MRIALKIIFLLSQLYVPAQAGQSKAVECLPTYQVVFPLSLKAPHLEVASTLGFQSFQAEVLAMKRVLNSLVTRSQGQLEQTLLLFGSNWVLPPDIGTEAQRRAAVLESILYALIGHHVDPFLKLVADSRGGNWTNLEGALPQLLMDIGLGEWPDEEIWTSSLSAASAYFRPASEDGVVILEGRISLPAAVEPPEKIKAIRSEVLARNSQAEILHIDLIPWTSDRIIQPKLTHYRALIRSPKQP